MRREKILLFKYLMKKKEALNCIREWNGKNAHINTNEHIAKRKKKRRKKVHKHPQNTQHAHTVFYNGK